MVNDDKFGVPGEMLNIYNKLPNFRQTFHTMTLPQLNNQQQGTVSSLATSQQGGLQQTAHHTHHRLEDVWKIY